jgi:RND family efflux transporter MFP subunit
MSKKTVVIVLAVFLALSGCKNEEKSVKVVKSVKVYEVKEKQENSRFSYPCRSKFLKESKLSFKVPGNIKNIFVNAGDKVKKGQTLAELDSSDYLLVLKKAKAALLSAKHQLEAAFNVYKRVKALYIANNVSKNDFDKAKAAYYSAKALSEAATEDVKLASNRLEYTKLKSPVNGDVAYILAEEGENIGAYYPFCVVTTLNTVEVQALLPDSAIINVKIGDSAKVKFNVIEDKTFEGVVTEISSSALKETNTYPVTVRLNETDNRLRSGLIGKLIFESNGVKKIITIPSQSVLFGMSDTFVFKLQKRNGKFWVKKTKVKLGKLTANGFVLLDGLVLGDKIVSAGANQLEDGLEVKIAKNLE